MGPFVKDILTKLLVSLITFKMGYEYVCNICSTAIVLIKPDYFHLVSMKPYHARSNIHVLIQYVSQQSTDNALVNLITVGKMSYAR